MDEFHQYVVCIKLTSGLTYIKEQSRLSPGGYGRPRMRKEQKAVGLNVGKRRVLSNAVCDVAEDTNGSRLNAIFA